MLVTLINQEVMKHDKITKRSPFTTAGKSLENNFLHGYHICVPHEDIICNIYHFSKVNKYFPLFNKLNFH